MSTEAMKRIKSLLQDTKMIDSHTISAVVAECDMAILAQQPATPEPVVSRNPFASRCYTMSESHLSGHRLIVGFEKLGDAQDAHEWVARQGRGDFTHPATAEPVDFPAGAIVNGRTLMDRIEAYPFASEGGDLRMCSDWHELRRCFEHLADYVSPRPAPSVPDDHQIAALVNKVRDIARMFHDHQSLRERIAIELVPVLKAKEEAS